jgi:hypothetical protein
MRELLIVMTGALATGLATAAGPPTMPVTIVDTPLQTSITNVPLPVTVAGQPIKVSNTQDAMPLGTAFRTVELLCGAVSGPSGDCPQWKEPLGEAYLLHSVSLLVKADGNCSAIAWLKFSPAGGSPQFFKVLTGGVNAHADAASGSGQEGGADSVAIAFPKPIRVGPDDQFGVGRVYGGGTLCAVSVSYGVELAD